MSSIVLVQPETGDDLQWEKAGQLEIADIVVVHKSDLPGAERVESQLRELLNLPGCRGVPVVRVSSSKGLGLPELWAAVEACAHRGRGQVSSDWQSILEDLADLPGTGRFVRETRTCHVPAFPGPLGGRRPERCGTVRCRR